MPDPSDPVDASPVNVEGLARVRGASRGERWFRSLVQNASDVIAVLEADGTVRYVSPAIERMLGYTPEERVGRNGFELLHPDDLARARSKFAEALRNPGVTLPIEVRMRHRDGSWRHVELTGTNLFDDQSVRGIVVNWRDITERKRVEEALREAETKYRTLVEQLPAITYINTRGHSNGKLYVSPQIESVLGVSVAEWTSDPRFWVTLLHPEDRQRVLAEVARSYETGELLASEYRMIARDGRVVWFRDEGTTVQDDAGGFYYHHGVMLDVTERKEAEERLKESEQRYRAVIEQTTEGIYLGDADTKRVLESNAAFQRMLGYSAQELRGMHIYDFVAHDPDDIDSVFRGVLDRGHAFIRERKYRRKDGSVVDVETNATVISYHDREVVCTVARDVTERKKIEEVQAGLARQAELRADVTAALAESGALPSTLQRCAEAIVANLGAAFARIWTLDEEEKMLELQASAGMYTHLDGPHGRVPVGEYKIGLIAQARLPHLTNDVLNDPRISDKEWAKRERIIAFAGYPLLVEDRLVGVTALFARVPLTEDTIEALALIADVIAQGIERKWAEEALRRSERSLAEAQRIAHIGNWEYEVQEDRAHWSDEMYRIFGFSPGGFIPTYKRFLGLVHPDDKELIQRAVRETLYDGERHSIEYRIVIPNGGVRCVHSEYEVFSDEAGKPKRLIGTVHDITERKRAEEEVKEANRRLAELAVLRADFTAMVAHELDTPLAVIRGYADMLATGELGPAESERALSQIQAETEVLNALVEDVRVAASAERRDFAVNPREVPVDELLDDAARFVATLPGDHPLILKGKDDVVRWDGVLAGHADPFVFGGGADGPKVWADRYRIDQVLRNLLANAVKYSPEGAPIELRAVPGEPSGRVRIEVIDRGPGIHPDDVERIFEKFGRGRDPEGRKVSGVGLGLYLSRRILRAHGSDLTFDSTPEGGSVFGFELKAADE
ncbi:MAG: PAS domain S-box protein [Actinomycetota bacterium]|nr:PAS domain S-box protein [Actinomycetota bacterium]